MASFDPSVIADIGGNQPDVAGSMAKAFTLKDLMNENQLSELKLNSEKRATADQNAARSILSQSDLTTDKGVTEAAAALTKAGQPDAAMKVRSYAQQYQSGQVELYRQKVDLAEQAQGIITGKIDAIWSAATQMKESKTPDGRPKYTDASINAFISGQIPVALSELQTSDLPDPVKKAALGGVQPYLAKSGSAITYDQLSQLEQQSKDGYQRIRQHQQDILGQRKEDTAERSESERERHDTRMEDLAATNPNRAAPPAGAGDLLAAFTAGGVPIPPAIARNRQTLNATMEGLIKRNPGKSVDEIVQGVKSGDIGFAEQKKTELAFSSGKQGDAVRSINVSIQHLDVLDKAMTALENGDTRAFNAARQEYKKQTGDEIPTDFDAAAEFVGNEVTKAGMGSGASGALADREGIKANISRAASQRQLSGQVRTYKSLLAGQLKGLRQQYESGKGTDFDSKVAPETRAALGGKGSGSQPPPAALKSLKEGVHTKFGNGQTWTLQDGKPVQVQ